jgi:hypothetical protein
MKELFSVSSLLSPVINDLDGVFARCCVSLHTQNHKKKMAQRDPQQILAAHAQQFNQQMEQQLLAVIHIF